MTRSLTSRGWILKARLVGLIALAVTVLVTTAAQAQPTTSEPFDSVNAWLKDNALAIAVLLFHFGVTWREFLDHRRQLARIPDTYARQDLIRVQLDEIRSDVRDVKRDLGRMSGARR